jgi:hypothetical protein
MPLLHYYSNADLNNTETNEDYVYFTAPFTFINYPFNWVTPMVIVAGLLFLLFVFYRDWKTYFEFARNS